MKVDDIIKSMECMGKPRIKHISSCAIYTLKDILKVKIAGEWFLGATYYDEKGLFCRGLEDFEGFKYLHNEVENK